MTTNTTTTRNGRETRTTTTTMITPQEIGGITVDRVIIEHRAYDGDTSTYHHASNGTQFVMLTESGYNDLLTPAADYVIETNTVTHTIKVPKAFWDDHCERDCVTSEVVKVVKTKHYMLTLNTAELLELLSDANHYAESASSYEWDMQWCVSSARATRAAIVKQIGAYALLSYIVAAKGTDIADLDETQIRHLGRREMGRAFAL
jgi:hypothetical protein